MYAYAGNNPVAFADPYGLEECVQKGNCTQSEVGEQGAAHNKYLADIEFDRTHGLETPAIDPVDILAGGIATKMLVSGLGRTLVKEEAQIQINKRVGDEFRDEIADLFRENGYDVATEVSKRTPFGRRVIDIEVSRDGQVLGGIETKTGNSPYSLAQRAKDAWLRLSNYYVDLVRK